MPTTPVLAVAHDGYAQLLAQSLDLRRVFANQQVAQVFNRAGHHPGPAGSFTRANQTGIGVHGDEQPVAAAGQGTGAGG